MTAKENFDLTYKRMMKKFIEYAYDNFKNTKSLAKFAVYCKEKHEDDFIIRLLAEDKHILDEFEKSLKIVCQETSIPILFTLSGSVTIPVFPNEGEMLNWMAVVKESIGRERKKRKSVMKSVVYTIALSEQLRVVTRFINTLWDISSLKSDLDGQESTFLLLEGFDGVYVRNPYNLPAEYRRKRKYLSLTKYYGKMMCSILLRSHDFFISSEILTKRYDRLLLLTDSVAKALALKMSLK